MGHWPNNNTPEPPHVSRPNLPTYRRPTALPPPESRVRISSRMRPIAPPPPEGRGEEAEKHCAVRHLLRSPRGSTTAHRRHVHRPPGLGDLGLEDPQGGYMSTSDVTGKSQLFSLFDDRQWSIDNLILRKNWSIYSKVCLNKLRREKWAG